MNNTENLTITKTKIYFETKKWNNVFLEFLIWENSDLNSKKLFYIQIKQFFSKATNLKILISKFLKCVCKKREIVKRQKKLVELLTSKKKKKLK